MRAVALACALPAAHAHATPLDTCRTARTQAHDDALATCRSAADTLQRSGDNEGAFEALMHSAELATQQSKTSDADAVLAQAQHLLPQVNDPLAAHRLHRRRGLLAYHLGKPAAALGEFLEALAAATAGEGDQARAISHNDLGVAYQKLGDYTAALDHFQRSLELKRDRPDAELAATLANVGMLYRQLGDSAQSGRFLQRALAAQDAAAQPVPAARTREELGLLQRALGDVNAAATQFAAAWQTFADATLPRDQMRVALRHADLDAERGDAANARLWLQRARDAAATLKRDPLLQADLLDLRLASDADSRRAAAEALERNVQRAGNDDPALAVDAWAALAAQHERDGDPARALQALQAYVARSEQLARSRHDERLDALRVQFDLATLEADRDRLELEQVRQASEIDRVRAQRLGIAAGAALLLGLLALLFQRRLHRQRLAAERDRLQLQQRIAQARDAADALRTDVRSLAWLLDRGDAAALVFDAAGQVRGLTPAAAAKLGVDTATTHTLQALVGAEVAAWAQARIEQASLGDDAPAAAADDPTLHVERLDREEELGVLSWHAPQATATAAVDVETAAPAIEFRAALVQLMQSSLALWERHTRKTRIDLAERSGVWRITIDDGRLRVRALDRYLALDTLPERPRWREVLRTAYFVLAELPLDTSQRDALETQIAVVQRSAPRRGA